MDDWIGIYKGMRLPLLAIILIGISFYVYRPKNRTRLEEAKYSMLENEQEENNGE